MVSRIRCAYLNRTPLFRGLAAVAFFFGAAPVGAQAPTDPAGGSPNSAHGAYTDEQASKGETTFRNTCFNCHSITEFNGPSFRRVWAGRPVYQLFDQLRNTMPLDNPGGLSREDYAAVVAYLLKLNQYPPGTTQLPSSDADLKAIRF